MSEEQDLHSDKNTTSRFRGTKGFFFILPGRWLIVVCYIASQKCSVFRHYLSHFGQTFRTLPTWLKRS